MVCDTMAEGGEWVCQQLAAYDSEEKAAGSIHLAFSFSFCVRRSIAAVSGMLPGGQKPVYLALTGVNTSKLRKALLSHPQLLRLPS